MSQFMLLIRNQGIPMEGLSEEELGAHMQKWGAWMGSLEEQGKLAGGHPFDPQSSAILSNGGSNITNGFYTDSSNLNVGGYIFLNADSLEEAIEISKGCPALENPTSTLEVRGCVEMPVPTE